MAYNKAKEERKWRLWKETEKKQMRQLGVSEDIIERLHSYDWAIFNSDRPAISRPQRMYMHIWITIPSCHLRTQWSTV